MVRFVIAALFTLIFTAAFAGDYEDGMAAYDRKDYATALEKFHSAAQKGIADGQYLLGFMYETGQGVVKDYREAAHWYRLAALQGHHPAQECLGSLYGRGRGVLQNYVLAHMWLNIAAVNSNSPVWYIRDIAASKMTAQQIEQAQRMARECMASNFTKCD